jgi:hypothetical protein
LHQAFGDVAAKTHDRIRVTTCEGNQFGVCMFPTLSCVDRSLHRSEVAECDSPSVKRTHRKITNIDVPQTCQLDLAIKGEHIDRFPLISFLAILAIRS